MPSTPAWRRWSTLERRLGEVQATVETTAARAAASIEYAHGAAESEAQGDETDRGDRAAARGEITERRLTATIRLAVDLQALQTDGIADRGIGRYVAALSAALDRIDRLAAGLLAPELPPPLGLPPELAMSGPGALGRASRRCGPCVAEGGPDRAPRPRAVPPLRAARPLGPRRRPALGEPGPAPRRDPARPHPVARPASLPPHPRASRPLPGTRRVGGGRRSRAGGLRVHPVRRPSSCSGATPTRSSPSGAACHRSSRPSDGTDGEHFRWYLGELEDRPFVLTVGRKRHPQGHRAAHLGGGPAGPGRVRPAISSSSAS